MRKNIILAEMYGLQVMLLEGRMDFLKTKYAPLLLKNRALVTAFERQTGSPDRTGGDIIDAVANYDPDKTKKYTQWLLDLVVKNNIRLDDLPKAKNTLAKFEKIKSTLPVEQRDIRRFKTMADLDDVVDPATPQQSQRSVDREYEKEMYKQAVVDLNTERYRIVNPRTQEAACYFGKNTKWCTAADENNMFKSYAKEGPLYIILEKKTNKRWQFFWNEADLSEKQLMDERDQYINPKTFEESHPEIVQFFSNQGLFLSLASQYRYEGDTEGFRSSLSKAIYDSFKFKDVMFVNDGADIALLQFANVHDLIENHGGYDLDWAYEVTDGGKPLPKLMSKKISRQLLLKGLDYTQARWIRMYMKDKHNFDPKYDSYTVSSLLRFQEEIKDPELEHAFENAYAAGMGEKADQREVIADYMKLSILATPYIYFQHGDRWTKEFSSSAPVCIAPNVQKIIDEMETREDVNSEILAAVYNIGSGKNKIMLRYPSGNYETSTQNAFNGYDYAKAGATFLADITKMVTFTRAT